MLETWGYHANYMLRWTAKAPIDVFVGYARRRDGERRAPSIAAAPYAAIASTAIAAAAVASRAMSNVARAHNHNQPHGVRPWRRPWRRRVTTRAELSHRDVVAVVVAALLIAFDARDESKAREDRLGRAGRP